MTDPRFAEALALCRAGRFADAERALRALVARAPADADALQLLGIAVSSLGRVEESLHWFERAKAARPGSAALMQNRAQSLFKLGRFAEARAEARAIASIDPASAAARDLMARIAHEEAVAHHAAGRFAEAIEGYRGALALGLASAQAHLNLGNALKMSGRDAEAAAQFLEALRLDPASPAALANYGAALTDAGRPAEAVPLLERAAALDPNAAATHNLLGAAYFALSRFDQAVECHRRALALRPDFDFARNNLGNALSACGRKDEALQAFRDILARHPDDENALSNMGVVLQETGDVAGARASFERALRAKPDFPLALTNLGFLSREAGRLEEAAGYLERVLALQPGNARAAYNLALLHLGVFRFEEGWRLHEARFRTTPPVTARREFPCPAFTVRDFGGGHRLAVWREQGVGDQILYSTALADLEARGQDFVLEIDARLVPAVRRAHPGWRVVAPEDSAAAFGACDRHGAMADVAGLLRPSLQSFAAQPRAFLAADTQRAARYREALARDGREVVGISWRSFQPKSRAYLEARKSAPLQAFARLAARDDLRLVDLQYGDTAAERERFASAGHRLERIDGLDLFNDLEGVIAAIEACDVVVTTSSVTAHLAGAAGKRTLLIYLHGVAPFHYWAPGADGACLWHPSVRIVSGVDVDSWERAIERVDELVGR